MRIFKLLMFLIIFISISSCLKDKRPFGSNDDIKIEFPIDCTEREELSGKIVFSSFKTGKGQIYVMNADGTNIKQITHSSTRSSIMPSWSPDGKKIVFLYDSLATTAGTPIYIMNADGSNIKPMYHEDGKRFPQWGSWPKWSPDGNKIVFEYCLGCETSARNIEIYLYDFLSDSISRLTYNPYYDGLPSWSPDGSKIIFVSDRDSYPVNSVYTMDINGENQERLLRIEKMSTSPAWSPFNNVIAFTSEAKIYLYDLLTKVVLEDEFFITDMYLPGPISWSPGGKHILCVSISQNGREKYLVSIDLCENKIEKLLDDSKVQSADWISFE